VWWWGQLPTTSCLTQRRNKQVNTLATIVTIAVGFTVILGAFYKASSLASEQITATRLNTKALQKLDERVQKLERRWLRQHP